MAAACVVRASPAYLGLATKVISEHEASSIPRTPVTSMLPSPRNSAPSRSATSASFMQVIVMEHALLTGASKSGLVTLPVSGRLFGEQIRLHRLQAGLVAARGEGMDDSQNGQLANGTARDVNPLRVGAGIGRYQEQADPIHQRAVVAGYAFQFLAIAERNA